MPHSVRSPGESVSPYLGRGGEQGWGGGVRGQNGGLLRGSVWICMCIRVGMHVYVYLGMHLCVCVCVCVV